MHLVCVCSKICTYRYDIPSLGNQAPFSPIEYYIWVSKVIGHVVYILNLNMFAH